MSRTGPPVKNAGTTITSRLFGILLLGIMFMAGLPSQAEITEWSLLNEVVSVASCSTNCVIDGCDVQRGSKKSNVKRFLGTSTGFASGVNPTLDEIYLDSSGYLSSEHATYTLSTTKGSNTHTIQIGTTKYYYTPQESTSAKNVALVNLVKTGSSALIEGSSSNYVFYDGVKYWTYDTLKLPKSVYTVSAGDSSDYNFVINDGTTPSYWKIDVPASKVGTSSQVTWSDTSSNFVLYIHNAG